MEVSAKQVSDLKGMEFDYNLGSTGVIVKAYVAQADIEKGITIMGSIPDDIGDNFSASPKNVDIILCCLNCNGRPNRESYKEWLSEYVRMVNDGYVDFNANTSSGNYDEVESACTFL